MTFYVGSTKDLEKRLDEHQKGQGANYTKKRLPVTLLYYEEYDRIDVAFQREKQVQGWSRAKKRALIEGKHDELPQLAACTNRTHFKNKYIDTLGMFKLSSDSSKPPKPDGD